MPYAVLKYGPADDTTVHFTSFAPAPATILVAPYPGDSFPWLYGRVENADYPGALRYRINDSLGAWKGREHAEYFVYVPDFPLKRRRRGGLLRAVVALIFNDRKEG
jgi:hypothetical protein